MFDDPYSIVAAVAGGAAGIWLMTRFGGFRDDLGPEDADRFEKVERLYEDQ